MHDENRLRWIVAAIGVIGALAVTGCARPGPATPTPASRAVRLAQWNAGFQHVVARDDYDGAGYEISGISLAAHKDVYWDAINPANGIYDWDGRPNVIDGIDDYLTAVEGQTITLESGQVIPRPVWFTVPVFWTQHPTSPADCANNVPAWLKNAAPDHVIGAWTPTPVPGGQPLATPNPQNVPGLDYAAFRTAYRALLLALAQHIQALPENQRAQIAGFFVPGGYNNENQIEASYCNLFLGNSALGAEITKSEYWAFISDAVAAFHEALPDYPIFTLAAAHTWPDQRCLLEQQIVGYETRHVGLGFNGMQPDVPGYIMRPASQVGCGSVEVMARNVDALPEKAEPAQAYQDDYQRMYWAWLFSIGALRVDMVDMQDEWFRDGEGKAQFIHFTQDYGFPASFYDFVLRNLGNSAGTAKDIWLAFHTTEYPRTTPGADNFQCYDAQGNVYCHGWEGNFNHFLSVSAGTVTARCSVAGMPTCQDAGLPTHSGTSPWGSSTDIYSRHAGRLDSPTTTLVVSPTLSLHGYLDGPVFLRVAWLGNATGTITVRFPIGSEEAGTEIIERVNDGAWHWTEFTLSEIYIGNVLPSGGMIDVSYTGPAPTLHMIWLDLSSQEGPPGSTPTPTPTRTPTVAVTPSSTPTPGPLLAHFTEYSPRWGVEEELPYDWFPDGRLDAGDTFVEFYSESPARAGRWRLTVAEEGQPAQTYVFSDTLYPGPYVLWNADMGLLLPKNDAVTLTLAEENASVVTTAVISEMPGYHASMQWCGNQWQADLPSPGRECGVWTVVPTPTAWPTPTP